jgi:cell division protein FtsW
MTRSLSIILLVLVAFGLIVLSSAGIVEGQKTFGSSYYFLKHQILYGVLPGLMLLFLFFRIDYKIWKKLSLPILFLVLLAMLMVFIPNFGYGIKGANRWLSIGGFSFQPSEFLKLSVIIYLAAWFGSRDERIKNKSYGVAPFFVVLIFIGLLLMLQPDIGTLVVITVISLAIYFFAGADAKHMVAIVAILAVAVSGLILLEPYRLNRIKTFLDPSLDPRGISYQVNQSHIAIGSGGMLGTGFGKSTQKFGFLPEVVNDSIFAVIAEELGFIGSAFTLGLFIILTSILIRITKNTRDKFGRLFVMGMCSWVIFQAFTNIMAVSGLAPLTGIPLPLISFGGTAMIATLAGMGIVLNIAKRA